MTRLNRRRLLTVATAAGVAAAAPSGRAAAHSDTRPPDLVGVQAANGASVIAQHVVDRRTVDITIDSVALGQTASARVILPARFGSRSAAPWPVLYLLHGGYGNYTDWTRQSTIADLTRKSDVLVVMPDGGKLGFYTDWWARGGGKPGWETFHLVELTQIIERGLGAGDRRAIAGLSMGGFGAISYAGRRPGFFRRSAAHSTPSTRPPIPSSRDRSRPGSFRPITRPTATMPSHSSATRPHSARSGPHTTRRTSCRSCAAPNCSCPAATGRSARLILPAPTRRASAYDTRPPRPARTGNSSPGPPPSASTSPLRSTRAHTHGRIGHGNCARRSRCCYGRSTPNRFAAHRRTLQLSSIYLAPASTSAT
jgi:poly(3-hydroxybutyrate) depolymerase